MQTYGIKVQLCPIFEKERRVAILRGHEGKFCGVGKLYF